METLQAPLSKNQLELLSMFNNRFVSDEEWETVKQIVADLFARKSVEAAEKAWDEKQWNQDNVEQILKTHLRTPYNPGNQLG